jgi:hypothetical protein
MSAAPSGKSVARFSVERRGRFAQKATVSTLAMVRRSFGVEAKGRYSLSTWP